jgi:hypothetical protein
MIVSTDSHSIIIEAIEVNDTTLAIESFSIF